MSFSPFLSRSAQSHALINRAVIADLGGFAYNYACSVVDKNALSDFCGRMNFNARFML